MAAEPPPAPSLPGNKERRVRPAGGREGGGERFRPAPREAAGAAREGRPAAPGSLFSAGRRPPPHPPPRRAPQPTNPQGPDTGLPNRQRKRPSFSPLPGLRGAAGTPPPPKSPLAPGRPRGDSHTSPPGGRSAGLLRLGWSRANGWAPRGPRPPHRGACGPATLSPPNAPARRPARTPAPQPPRRRGPQGLPSSTRSTARRENKGEEFPGPRSAEDALRRTAPPEARGRHFVPPEKKRTGRGGHFRALLAAAARHSPSPRTQQPRLQLPPQDQAVGDGEGEGKGTENKKGEGKGEEGIGDRLEALSSEESPLRPPPGTRRRLHRAPTHRWRRGVSGAALITLGRRTRRGRPEWLRRYPISGRAAVRRQSAQDAGGAAGKLGCGAARRSAQSRIREGCGPPAA